MPDLLFIDTDVIIDYLRNQPSAVAYLEALIDPICISAITAAELYSGVRDSDGRRALDSFLAAFELVVVDKDIAVQGGIWRRDYGKSHNVGPADALIAAIAQIKGATLVTLNKKHFPMLSTVTVPYVKS